MDTTPLAWSDWLATGMWRPIPGCPGRWVRRGGPVAHPPWALAGRDRPVPVTRCPGARDPMAVIPFPDGGGLISYRFGDGRWIHTLNTTEGMTRKLALLGLKAEGSSHQASPVE